MTDDHDSPITHNGPAERVAIACIFIIPGALGVLYFALGALT